MTTSVRRLDGLHRLFQDLQLKEDIQPSHSRERVTILQLAARVEESLELRSQWFTDDRIDSLGGLTAAELVALGQGEQVKQFLHRIIYCDRQRAPIY
ncbi:hypothetical protein HDE76_000638 [Rhodanobacter sp. ANJX3]|uniref:hypothetical protein n=1 Tax=unclassified Rhodanobacter TaxID=2621553 RepID=UPI0015C73C13|nr:MULTISPECIES: hypothetical protein [unclassified Rhodanobacter]MBB5357456.1 hypothetical protein [Rhodanobacter sp. ANJX3]NYE27505.1 hypothetical protein [Rhodanobacter sp. K2T2]